MPQQNLTTGRRRKLLAFVRRYPTVHLVIGLAGNVLFILGSLLYVLDATPVARYLFLVGSSAMFLGALGDMARAVGRRTLQRHDIDPATGGANREPLPGPPGRTGHTVRAVPRRPVGRPA
ncbi:YrhK family protein, partial [Micromonospora zhanjiangensis]